MPTLSEVDTSSSLKCGQARLQKLGRPHREYLCALCHMNCYSETRLKRHMSQKHQDCPDPHLRVGAGCESTDNNDPCILPIDPLQLNCPMCRKTSLPNPEALFTHVNGVHRVMEMPYPCYECRLTGFKLVSRLCAHQQNGHCWGSSWENAWLKKAMEHNLHSDSSSAKRTQVSGNHIYESSVTSRSAAHIPVVCSDHSDKLEVYKLSSKVYSVDLNGAAHETDRFPNHKFTRKLTDLSGRDISDTDHHHRKNSHELLDCSNSDLSCQSSIKQVSVTENSPEVHANLNYSANQKSRCLLLDWDSFISLPRKSVKRPLQNGTIRRCPSLLNVAASVQKSPNNKPVSNQLSPSLFDKSTIKDCDKKPNSDFLKSTLDLNCGNAVHNVQALDASDSQFISSENTVNFAKRQKISPTVPPEPATPLSKLERNPSKSDSPVKVLNHYNCSSAPGSVSMVPSTEQDFNLILPHFATESTSRGFVPDLNYDSKMQSALDGNIAAPNDTSSFSDANLTQQSDALPSHLESDKRDSIFECGDKSQLTEQCEIDTSLENVKHAVDDLISYNKRLRRRESQPLKTGKHVGEQLNSTVCEQSVTGASTQDINSFLVCSLCDKRFVRRKYFIKHVATCISTPSPKTNKVDESYSGFKKCEEIATTDAVDASSENGDNALICSGCAKSFVRKKSFIKHATICIGTPVCKSRSTRSSASKILSSPRSIKQRTSCNQKPTFLCEECGHVFNALHSYRRHLRTHKHKSEFCVPKQSRHSMPPDLKQKPFIKNLWKDVKRKPLLRKEDVIEQSGQVKEKLKISQRRSSTTSLNTSDTRSVNSDATTVAAVGQQTKLKSSSSHHDLLTCRHCKRSGFSSARYLAIHSSRCLSRSKRRIRPQPSLLSGNLAKTDKSFKCNTCSRVFQTFMGVKVHQATGCKSKTKKKSTDTLVEPTGAYMICPGCPTTAPRFVCADQLLTHLLTLKSGHQHTSNCAKWPSVLSVPNLGFGCHICGQLLASESRLDKHKKAVHEAWFRMDQKKLSTNCINRSAVS